MNTILETEIQDTPCQIKVTDFYYAPPSKLPAVLCDNPAEFYGDYWVEFEVLDMDGNPSEQIESEMTQKDTERIEQEILDKHQSFHEAKYYHD